MRRDAGRRARRRHLRAAAPLQAQLPAHLERAADPDDPAAAARRAPRGAGSRGRRDLQGQRPRRCGSRSAPKGSRRGWGRSDVAADTLVGADGANGIVAKTVGLEDGIVRGVALEGNVGWEHLDRERFASTAVVELGQPDGGYGWLFPKGDHANLGVGGWDRGRAAPARPPRAALAHLRDRPRRAHRRSRPPAADAPRRRHDPGPRQRRSRRRRGGARRSALGRRHVRGVHLGPARGRGHPRRRSRRGIRRRWRSGSTTTPAPRGRPSARSTATPRCASGPLARRACSASSAGCCAAMSGIRTRPGASPGRRCASLRASRAASDDNCLSEGLDCLETGVKECRLVADVLWT